jgi:hypothetical protein
LGHLDHPGLAKGAAQEILDQALVALFIDRLEQRIEPPDQLITKPIGAETPILCIELRSSGGDPAKPMVLESPVRPNRFFSTWSSLRLEGQNYADLGQVLAWRVSLWQGDQLLAEQKSFLW